MSPVKFATRYGAYGGSYVYGFGGGSPGGASITHHPFHPQRVPRSSRPCKPCL